MTLREDLADWCDWDQAARAYGIAMGVFDGATERQVSRAVLTDNALGEGLHRGMLALVDAGVVERREEPDEQFRWTYAGAESLPGALESWDGQDKPAALSLPGLSSTHPPIGVPAPRRHWWQRG